MEIIDQIRQTANISEIASHYTKLQIRGRKQVGLCPFHSEKTPSFYLDEDKQLYHCFGCGAGGDIFTLVMEKENLSFPEALRYLAEKYHIEIPEPKAFSPQYQSLKENIYKITEDALAFFRKNLTASQEGKKALDYLRERNVEPDTIRTLQLGYSSNSWDSLLNYFKRKKVSPDLLEQAGLVLRRQNKEGHYDRFRGRLIFPIFNDRTGKVVAFGGRTLFGDDPKYLNSPDTPIYSKGNLLYGLNFSREFIREQDAMILVEGYTDFLALFQRGIKHTAASLGTSLTPHQIDLVRRRFTSNIIACYDGDLAGRKASYRAVSLCFEQGAQIRVTLLPKGEDPDSFIEKNGSEAFLKLVQNSASGVKYIIDYLSSGRRPTHPESKAKIAREVLKEINKIPDAIVRSEYIKKISAYLDIDEQEFRRIVIGRKAAAEPSSAPPIQFLQAEKRLLQIIFEDTRLALHVFKIMVPSVYSGLSSESLWPIFAEYLKQKKIPDIFELKKKIDPKLFEQFMRVLSQESEQPPTENEAIDLINTLKMFSLERERKKISPEIAKYAKSGHKDKVASLQRRVDEISKQMMELSQ